MKRPINMFPMQYSFAVTTKKGYNITVPYNPEYVGLFLEVRKQLQEIRRKLDDLDYYKKRSGAV